MYFKEIEFGGKAYYNTIELRYKVLRQPLNLKFDAEALALEYKDNHLCAFSTENKLVACLIMSPLENAVVKMRQFAVEPEFQGQSIGRRLVSFAEQWASENHYNRIILHARLTAIPFYLKLGYIIEGDEFMEVTIPHRFMSKDI